MSEHRISYADLSAIENALSSIGSNINGMNYELNNITSKQDQIEADLQQLADIFADFIETDANYKRLQLAETRVGNLRQELQINFGYYAEIRRMATGILQGVDTGIIGDDTLKFSTEEIMIKAPGYWLAPALVAIASWIRNDNATCEKALKESLKRDDYKATLFFMLVMRRLNRNDASLKWLERYFMHQNPQSLDRELIIVLEAITTGVFPPASRQLMMLNLQEWLKQLTQSDTFINKQKAEWIEFFSTSGSAEDNKYLLLEKFSTNWKELRNSMREAKAHEELNSYFNNIISFSAANISKTVKIQLDEILTLLVTNFDDEELPLQKQIMLNQFIIQTEGDKARAEGMMNAEEHIFDEKVDFLQLLTNAAFNPEAAGGTKATQALAVSISQPWIIEAYDQFTAQSRNRLPSTIDFLIDGWNSTTKDGSDEKTQITKQEEYYANLQKQELQKATLPYGNIAIGALICLAGIWGGASINPIIGLIGIGIGGVFIWNNFNKFNTAKRNIIGAIAERQRKAREVLRGCIAETVDYRKEYAMEDKKAEKVRDFIKGIKVENFSSVSKDVARNVI